MQTQSQSLVLVLDADQRSALAAVRSLGKRDLRVVAAGSGTLGIAGTSRFCTDYLQSPSPAREPQQFVEWLLATVERLGVRFLLPVTEVTAQLVLMNRERLPAACVIPFADFGTVMRLSHKGNLLELAKGLGLSCPASVYYENSASLDPAKVSAFPAVLKPCLSNVYLGDRWLSTAVRIVRDRDELSTALARFPEYWSHPFMLQAFIPGTGAGVFALYDHGQEIAKFAHRRLREKPPSGGVSVLCESADPSAAALAMARALLGAVRWHGVAMVEVRIDPDGKPYLMEVNTRFWGSLQLAIDAGVDFPWLLYQVCTGQAPATAEGYATGRRLRWWLGDLDSLYLYLRDTRYSVAEKITRLIRFLTPDPGRTRHEIFRWSDPAPAWHELKAWLGELLR